MQGFEKQLQSIGDKSALHDWIDNLPDDAVVLLLAQHPEGSRYNTFGQPTFERLLWMTKTFENHLMSDD